MMILIFKFLVLQPQDVKIGIHLRNVGKQALAVYVKTYNAIPHLIRTKNEAN